MEIACPMAARPGSPPSALAWGLGAPTCLFCGKNTPREYGDQFTKSVSMVFSMLAALKATAAASPATAPAQAAAAPSKRVFDPNALEERRSIFPTRAYDCDPHSLIQIACTF